MYTYIFKFVDFISFFCGQFFKRTLICFKYKKKMILFTHLRNYINKFVLNQLKKKSNWLIQQNSFTVI